MPREVKGHDPTNLFTVTSSPHIFGGDVTGTVMRDVLIALVPALAVGAWVFGARVLLVAAVTVAASVAAEWLSRRAMRRPQTVGDLSAAVTGLLLAMNLPPSIELWKAAIGGAFAIVVVKQVFGGIGQNFMNPALAARIALLVSWGRSMTLWQEPVRGFLAAPSWQAAAVAGQAADAVSGATPLALAKAAFAASGAGEAIAGQAALAAQALPSYLDLFLGNVAGCIGETSAIALLIGAAFLLIRRVISWHVPATFIGTVALLTWAFGGRGGLFSGDPLYHVLSGGLMIGAFFMATDYSTSPMTGAGKLIMGVGCGALTTVIRLFAGYPEGVSFAIVIMNVATPLIDRFTVPKPFGGEAVKAHANA